MLNTRQYNIEFGASMLMYMITLFASIYFVLNNQDSPWRIWVSITPVLPAIFMAIAIIRALRKLDELQQQIQLMSFAVSFAIVALTTFTYGFLENVGFPHIPYIWILPFMIGTWGIITQIVIRRYK